jgi:tetratricopeptide (TPR) repeat protein
MVESKLPDKHPGFVDKHSFLSRRPVAEGSALSAPSPRPRGGRRTIRLARNFERNVPSSAPWIALRERTGTGLRLFSIWTVAVLVLLGTGGIGLKWLFRYGQTGNCQSFVPMTSDSERLYCIQQAVDAGNLESLSMAMNLAGTWGENHPLFAESQHLLRDWSGMLFNLAQQELKAGRMDEAMRLVAQIPPLSPLYPEAQVAIATWQEEWHQGEKAMAQFEQALQQRDWQGALAGVASLSQLKSDYWRVQKVEQLNLRLSREQAAAASLQAARDLAAKKTAESLAEAMVMAQKMDSNVYVRHEAQHEREQWGRDLLQIAAEQLNKGDFAGAIATAQSVPQDNPLYQEAQDWIALSRASQVAQKDDLDALLKALETVRQIEPESPLFPQARTRAQLWQAKIQG